MNYDVVPNTPFVENIQILFRGDFSKKFFDWSKKIPLFLLVQARVTELPFFHVKMTRNLELSTISRQNDSKLGASIFSRTRDIQILIMGRVGMMNYFYFFIKKKR